MLEADSYYQILDFNPRKFLWQLFCV